MAFLFRRPQVICQCQRSFSTSIPRAVSLQWEKNDKEALAEVLPPYPYGPTRWYKQSRLGLYGGQRIQFGNNVSGPFKAKTRRTWHPNVFTRKLFSKSLNRMVQVRVSARVLRTIDKLGGLDEYLLGEKPARIKELGESGWWLRWAIMQTPMVKKRFAEERIRLGLPEKKDDAEILTEAITTPEETELEAEDMESVPMDDAFQLEENETLPPIKFRVGPGQHVMLTANGWTRTRPDPLYFVNKRKQSLAERKFPDFVEKGMKLFEKKFDSHLQGPNEIGSEEKLDRKPTGKELDESERTQLLKEARRALRKELQEKVDELDERLQTAKNERTAERRALKQGKKNASREEQDSGLELA